MPSLSVILPIYNGAKFLDQQIQSIQAQSLTDWCMLVCDDGSTDNSMAVVERLASNDKRIHVIPTTGNQGQRRRLKQLADATRTELIAIADQDDIWAPDKLALLTEAIGDADMCFGPSWLIDEKGQEYGRFLADSLMPAYADGERLTLMMRSFVSAHAMVARRGLFNEMVFGRAKPFDWLMSLEAAWGNGIVYVPQAVTRHRMHGGNQANGMFAQTPNRPRVLSRAAFRTLPRRVERGRMHLMAMLEHMSFAENVSADWRQRCAVARQICEDGWYSFVPGAYRAANRSLLDQLDAQLRPIAGHDRDWRYFHSLLETLCTPTYSPARLGARRRRIEFEWDKG